jgi:hypothetical protein
MALKLQDVMARTPSPQILSVVGLNTSELDYDDLTMKEGFSDGTALGRFQWAQHLFATEFNATFSVPYNIYMPGLVRTKILRNEPQPMGTMVRLANRVIGIEATTAAENVRRVIEDVVQNHRKAVYYRVDKLAESPNRWGERCLREAALGHHPRAPRESPFIGREVA